MPSRIIRESATTSRSLNQLSDAGERIFWRLVTVADDHGRFDADPVVLLAKCFPLRAGSWKPSRIEKLRDELVAVGAARKRGVAFDDLLGGVERYRVWCEAKGIIGRDTVKQAGSFFGDEECWTSAWEIVSQPPSKGNDNGNGARKLRLTSGRVIEI